MESRGSVSYILSISPSLHQVVPSVPYAALSKAFSLIEATTKRLEKNAILTSFLLLVIQRSAEGDWKSLLQTVYLCINRVCITTNHHSSEFHIFHS